MGFLSFNEKYFLQKLTVYESQTLSDAQVLEARQDLKILDDLVDEGYAEKIFCRAYEQIREFETLYSQDLYFLYRDFTDGKFLVSRVQNEDIYQQALSEVNYMTQRR